MLEHLVLKGYKMRVEKFHAFIISINNTGECLDSCGARFCLVSTDGSSDLLGTIRNRKILTPAVGIHAQSTSPYYVT
jgi:hypothetical protein